VAPTSAPPVTVGASAEIRIGSDVVLDLGTLPLAGSGHAPTDLAHLLRVAAELIDGNRHDWPRQVWQAGDRVRLPGSLAYGRVAQVDPRTKEYVLDLGSRGLRRVLWSEVDQPCARPAEDVDRF
jgi:hypothetical protein